MPGCQSGGTGKEDRKQQRALRPACPGSSRTNTSDERGERMEVKTRNWSEKEDQPRENWPKGEKISAWVGSQRRGGWDLLPDDNTIKEREKTGK